VTGGLPPPDASRHLQACDVLVQPYPDGVSGRRGSVMAGLAHGVATATNAGRLTEPYWRESGGVLLAPGPSASGVADAAERLLADPALRARVGAAGRDLHERRFAVARTVEAILGASPVVGPAKP
jgi:glycosyltransferase involved in cell wall biosynthesis